MGFTRQIYGLISTLPKNYGKNMLWLLTYSCFCSRFPYRLKPQNVKTEPEVLICHFSSEQENRQIFSKKKRKVSALETLTTSFSEQNDGLSDAN